MEPLSSSIEGDSSWFSEVVALSVMMMAEGSSDSEAEQWRMRQWTAAPTADAAIDGRGVVGCHQCESFNSLTPKSILVGTKNSRSEGF
jgi:hypothetical protein